MFSVFVTFFKSLSLSTKLIIAGLIILGAIGAYVGYLSHRTTVAIHEREAAEKEIDRLGKQNDGLKVLANSANVAIEVEHEKKLANTQAANSDAANNIYANTRGRDSSTGTGNYAEAKRKFCAEFSEDSRCQ